MKSTRLLPLLAVGLLAACDETRNLLTTPATEQVQVAPRLVASSPLPGARLQITLVSGGKTLAAVDTPYQSGQKLSLGSVAVGDSFRVSAQGYDKLGNETLVAWTASFAGKAAGGSSKIQAADLIVQSPATDGIDTLTHPDSVVVGAGHSYTYDGSDPRSGASLVQKTVATTVLSKANLSISRSELVNGTVLWSPVRQWSDPGLFLVGDWWEVDTGSNGGRRGAYFIRLNKDHTYWWIPCDTLTMDSTSHSGTATKGHWSGDSTAIRYRGGDSTDVAIKILSSDTLGVSWLGQFGKMTRKKPDTDYVTPLLGTWWQLWYRGVDSIPLLQEHIIHSDGTVTIHNHYSQDSRDSTYVIGLSVTANTMKLMYPKSTFTTPYRLTEDSLVMGNGDILTRSEPQMLDPELIGTWDLLGLIELNFSTYGEATFTDLSKNTSTTEKVSSRPGSIIFYEAGVPTVQPYSISDGILSFTGGSMGLDGFSFALKQ